MQLLSEDSCTPAVDWWISVGKALGQSTATRGVPMVCGAGNCIGDMKDKQIKCYDERLSGNTITKLLSDRPSTFNWQNFAIWYGTYVKDKGFFNCINIKGCPLSQGCCKGWAPS